MAMKNTHVIDQSLPTVNTFWIIFPDLANINRQQTDTRKYFILNMIIYLCNELDSYTIYNYCGTC